MAARGCEEQPAHPVHSSPEPLLLRAVLQPRLRHRVKHGAGGEPGRTGNRGERRTGAKLWQEDAVPEGERRCRSL